MDVQHLSALIEMLSSLGFSASTGRILLFNACIRQKQFVIRERMCFGEDTINYQLSFHEDITSKRLTCSYYDATLRKAVEISASLINGVDVLELEKQMQAVDWQMPPENSSSDGFIIADKNTWKQEATIEEITRDLEALTSSAEGAVLANLLKYKFWTDITLQSTISELTVLKSKYELSQRFYIINGEGITATEAYRFLNNRWLERQVHANNRLLRKNAMVQHDAEPIPKSTNNKSKKPALKGEIEK
ncbi:hypothetical protein FC093_21890 [Ilyomonas limi]|uniref:Uncharacterized protein n=1 Tax=Ilyomonas limi TaxID=2575867 RepID=A0A4U3KR48_9BACT|nr:hypothetical protein [Ilyomonas limi]TKK64702.1 hypothetical protein FC093_21890 [Ilyomonas limi]